MLQLPESLELSGSFYAFVGVIANGLSANDLQVKTPSRAETSESGMLQLPESLELSGSFFVFNFPKALELSRSLP
jgi:hypothetical protein